MALQIPTPSEITMSQTNNDARHNVIYAIATDVHFWIPLTVLVAGLVLLDKLS